MSALPYSSPSHDEDIFKLCTKECGIITATEDQQYFALGCMFCTEKFLYFDAFIGHMQTVHTTDSEKGIFGGMFNDNFEDASNGEGGSNSRLGDEDDLNETDASLLVPQMVMIKEEVVDEERPENDNGDDDNSLIIPYASSDMAAGSGNSYYRVKQEHVEPHVRMEMDDDYGEEDTYGNYNDYQEEENEQSYQAEEEHNAHYDDLVEESLLGSGLVMHIKDRKMIQFLIESYRRNSFLWDHRHPQFRDRVKRQQFLEWILSEFKRRFNISLARDAITRKWDNLRTVYKRECNRMSQENTNVSTLWYFKELHFLNRLYGGNQKMSEAIVKETVYRRRYSALWNDVSTSKLLSMVERFPCFYDKYHIDYRSKEKRGEALQKMAADLQNMIEVTTIQISKRISQLRFDYSKQKQERLLCEENNRVFVSNYSYYDQMHFMDADIAPFKCEYCPVILQTPRELDVHIGTHMPAVGCSCPVCHLTFMDFEQLNRHKQTHGTSVKEVKYFCDLCTASFREKCNYEEHMRRHNDELFLPTLVNASSSNVSSNSLDGPFERSLSPSPTSSSSSTYCCDICNKSFSSRSNLNAHRALHSSADRNFKCDFPECGKAFGARQNLLEHAKMHYGEEDFNCDVCGKSFKSLKNLQNHKQIHDAVKRYVCKICGSAFAQAAGLYLHKRRHNRPNSRARLNY